MKMSRLKLYKNGYNTVTLTPSVDFTGGLGMEFSTGVKSIGQARVYAD